ncbi:HSP90 family protein [Clostridium sp. P21]|uniref:HSP90 family protein n=1 Tax=Clostridium muellerianum TaxID=2716538 RepID=A0A7Y0EFJ8_9CLOT|nr:HSP90 family protein [Clostridium muellerianum]NMM62584.1 HSP90 family protein [Clostridium muellerianum]
MENNNFQVNLEGIISLLSENLYKDKNVFLREILQNAVDAITARKNISDDEKDIINFELFEDTLVVEDNGIGLSKDDIENFLSVIGQSSKRKEILKGDFIGRFGIGLLSCFIVCDEITIITKKFNSKEVFKWVGKSDGTYEMKKLDIKISFGSKVYLKAKEGASNFFMPEYVYKTLNHYGAFLPYPILLTYKDEVKIINKNAQLLLEANHNFNIWKGLGKEIYNENFLDCIHITSKTANINGAAYILPRNTSLVSKVKGKIYVKGMFISDQCDKIMPTWAFFTRPLINAQNLRLTASREDFYEDNELELVRKEIAECFKSYFMQLSKNNPKKLEDIINIHHNSLKLMSVEEDDLYKIMINYFKFSTTMGKMTLFDIYKEYKVIKYTLSVDDYKQIEKVAKAQNICIVNGGYINDSELIEKFNFIVDRYATEVINPNDISNSFDELSFEQINETQDFIIFADKVLKAYSCSASIKKFNPKEVTAIYNLSNCTKMLKEIKESKENSVAENNFILAELASSFEKLYQEEMSDLCFNYSNFMIRKLIQCRNDEVKRSVINVIYVQALMAGNHKVTKEEQELFSNGINKLMDMAL